MSVLKNPGRHLSNSTMDGERGREPFLDEIDGFDIAVPRCSTSAHMDEPNSFQNRKTINVFERIMVAAMRRTSESA
jgi:hypothetical protein